MIEGRYSLDREIGRGGTGVVWLGRDEVLGRRAVLKRIGVLPGDDRTDDARAEREAHLSARLNHPHVVAVLDLVTDSATGDHWLVMEYVDGITLERFVRQHGPLAPDEAAPLLWQVADALSAAHAAGIVHRDVKPSNILVDRSGVAKLGDFGIARLATDPSLTQTGMMTGSPAYLAPEVASGGRGDPASDVWSLGATAFHVIAGRPPYPIGDNVLGALYRIVNEDPPQLPGAGWMAPMLEGTMAKDPAERWTAGQVRDFLTGRHQAVPTAPGPVSMDPPSDGHTRVLEALAPRQAPVEPEAQRSTSWRPPGTAVAIVGVVAALLVLIVLAASLSGRGRDPSSEGAVARGTAGPAVPTARPTAQGMEAFIREYVAAVARDPDQAWRMLTPKFQRESGGIEQYRSFWGSATDGRVLSFTADPAALTVSYQVHFDHFHNGPGPTVLDLVFQDGRYLIDGEHSKGFVPAG